MIVMKFGGSSVANRDQIEKVFEIVKGRHGRRPVVVSSAHKGVTDGLIGAARAAVRGELDPNEVVNHQAGIAASLGCPPALHAAFYSEIHDILRGISLIKELSPRSLDYISSFGERMSVRCLADFFSRNGLPSRAYDVWDLGFVTDSNFGVARPLPDYKDRMRKAFAESVPDDIVPVITGFIGKNEAGEITTVGRNGSDLTASLVAAAVQAEEVEIWTDTDGVMTADPSVVTSARNIPTMRFDEAAELAYFGSRVLHPSTLLPAMESNVPVRVMNTNRPDHRGTVIEEHATPEGDGITSIAYKENQAVLTLTSTRMFGEAGYLAGVFEVLGRHGVVIDLISTSEVSVSMTTHEVDKLRRAKPEVEAFGDCEVHEGKTILVVVGQSLASGRGLRARILRAVVDAGVEVEMLSYGLRSINFSMLIDDEDIRRAVPALHRVLFEDVR
jgi:aspartate kinase